MATAYILTTLSIALLLVVSALFSGSETAITAASRPRMHQLEQQGDPRAAIVNRLRSQGERLIGAILLGNNVVNIFASALATSVLIGAFGRAGVAYATIVMTVLVVVFAEVLPKTYALNHADRLALAVAPILRVVVFLFAPVTQAIQLVVRVTLRVFGVDLAATLGQDSEEELRGAIDLHTGSDPEIKQERKMLRGILDLADVDVDEIMTHRSDMVMIDVDAKPAEIVDQVLSSPFTRIPLWREKTDNIIGVLHVKALLPALRAGGGEIDALDVTALAGDPWFVPESTSLLDQLHAFRERHEHSALVVDEYGVLMGVVTLEDILEEIVGEIADEHDIPVPGVRAEPDGSYVVNGSVTIRDLNREFEWRLPDEEAATIAGLVMHEARRIPEIGQIFSFHDFRFEILRRKKNKITSIRITPMSKAPKQDSA